jgi:pimeloyl-ACP methyl ester carboxylesterase
MPRAISSGNAIAYDDVGTGEPALLFLPGWCANRTAFEDLLPLASKHRRCLALDWRGHGESSPPPLDFDQHAFVDDAMAVLAATGTHFVVPVAISHAGWVALELWRRLKARVPALVLIDWQVTEPPPPYLAVLQDMQSPDHWREAVEKLFSLWLAGSENPRLTRFVREGMGAYGFEMWSRAARSISSSYAASGSPLKALSELAPPPLVLHLYSTPPDSQCLAAQQAFAAEHPWYCVQKLEAQSHFPMFETPEVIASAIERFLA